MLDNSLSGGDTSLTGVNTSDENTKCTLSATTQSKIDATIDDFMKHYKISTKSKKKKMKGEEEG